jgi:hypothetical protein
VLSCGKGGSGVLQVVIAIVSGAKIVGDKQYSSGRARPPSALQCLFPHPPLYPWWIEG